MQYLLGGGYARHIFHMECHDGIKNRIFVYHDFIAMLMTLSGGAILTLACMPRFYDVDTLGVWSGIL